MKQRQPSFISTQFILDVIIILIGIIFMLDNFNIIYAGDFIRYWPALLIVWGVSKLTNTCSTQGKTFAWILITVGSLMVLDRMEIISFHLHDWWPLVLIIIGVSFLRGSMMRSQGKSSEDRAHLTQEQSTNQFIKYMALLSGVRGKVTTKEFRGGEITAIMGGCEIDLREAEIQGDEAVLDVIAVWGGIEISVPMGWTVVVKATPIMGGVDDKTYPSKDGSNKLLIITGSIVMGGVEIKN